MPSLIEPISAGAIESALNSLINPAGGSSGSPGSVDELRAALVFTSRLRQRVLAERRDRLANAQARAVTSIVNNPFADILQPAVQAAARAEVQDLTGQMSAAMANIAMELNPKSVSFEQPKRYVRQDTIRGTVFHHFTNDKGQNNDLLTIKFEGNTGNISSRGRTEEDRERSRQRLTVWHNLYQLTREPMILSDGTANWFKIDYVSSLFPLPVTFYGFFTKVLTFTESASKPNSRDYSTEFIVQATTPELDSLITSIITVSKMQSAATPTQESRVLTQTV